MGVRVLVAEDDERIGGAVREALAATGYEVVHVSNGESAFLTATKERFDMLILDIGLPGRDGLAVLHALRMRNTDLLTIVLSARSDVEDRVLGLQTGADDYLTKPFSMPELEARIQALLRRGRKEMALRLAIGDLMMDLPSRSVTRANCSIALTVLEFELIELLMRRSPSVVSRDTIARHIWKDVNRVTPLDNVIDVHIGRLRKKIDAPPHRSLIHTVRGVGFMLSERGPT